MIPLLFLTVLMVCCGVAGLLPNPRNISIFLRYGENPPPCIRTITPRQDGIGDFISFVLRKIRKGFQ